MHIIAVERLYRQIPAEAHMQSHEQSIKAQRITMEMNSRFHSPEELCELFSELTGKVVRDISIFPPFYTDYGKNITVGHHVFLNSGPGWDYHR